MVEPEEGTNEIDDAWEAELRRRVEDIRSGRIVGKPAEQLFAELDEEFP